MVRIERFTMNPKKPEPPYNPYDLVPLVINGIATTGRPYQFDSSPVNANTILNANGDPVLPTMCQAPCPQCGAGLDVPLPTDPISCGEVSNCTRFPKTVSELPPMPDPFRNPFMEGVMAVGDVDAVLVRVLDIPEAPAGTVADRLSKLPPVSEEEP